MTWLKVTCLPPIISNFQPATFNFQLKKTTPVSRVLYLAFASFHHLSMRPTLRGRTGHPPAQRKKKPLHIPGLHGLTARKVCLSQRVTHVAGGLLHHLFILTPFARGGLNFCNTICHRDVSLTKPPLFTGCGAHCSPDFPLRTRRSDGTALFWANIGEKGEGRMGSGYARRSQRPAHEFIRG